MPVLYCIEAQGERDFKSCDTVPIFVLKLVFYLHKSTYKLCVYFLLHPLFTNLTGQSSFTACKQSENGHSLHNICGPKSI